MFLQLDKHEPKEDEKPTEISFSKLTAKGNIQVIARGYPRIYFFNTSDTPLDMKKKIFQDIKECWGDFSEVDDNWISTAITIKTRNNSPLVPSTSRYATKRQACEFCGGAHDPRQNLCNI